MPIIDANMDMDLLETLKKLKSIEPGGDFTKRSRSLILYNKNTFPRNVFGVFTKTLETGASLALAGLLISVILGGVSRIKILEPLQITAIDPSSIRAEAEAIDIQIQLTGLDYSESAANASSESTISRASIGKPNDVAEGDAANKDAKKQEISIEEALELLSE